MKVKMLFKIIRIIVSNKFLLEKSLKEKAEELHYFNRIYGIFARHASSSYSGSSTRKCVLIICPVRHHACPKESIIILYIL